MNRDKAYIPAVSYTIDTGPFWKCLVRYGYDPVREKDAYMSACFSSTAVMAHGRIDINESGFTICQLGREATLPSSTQTSMRFAKAHSRRRNNGRPNKRSSYRKGNGLRLIARECIRWL